MNILILNELGKNLVMEDVPFIPRVGDSIDVFYRPLPIVKRVVCFPSVETLKDCPEPCIDAIIFT